jgi:predicted nucleic acid-binding protein
MKIDRGCRLLVDTNVMLEATDQDRPLHRRAAQFFQVAPEQGWGLFLATQNVREYLVVTTRPTANNGLGMPLNDALENIRRFRRRCSLIGETQDAGERFLRWAEQFQIHGKRLHDVQILATAACGRMHALITANPKDFPDIKEIEVIPLAELDV